MTGYVLEKVEDAWINYLSSSLSGSLPDLQFYRGVSVLTKDQLEPMVIVTCDNQQEVMYGTGIYRMNTDITMFYPYDDVSSVDTRNNYVATMSNVILGNDNIIDSLNSASNNLLVMDCTFGGSNNTFQDNLIINNIMLDMVVRQKT